MASYTLRWQCSEKKIEMRDYLHNLRDRKWEYYGFIMMWSLSLPVDHWHQVSSAMKSQKFASSNITAPYDFYDVLDTLYVERA